MGALGQKIIAAAAGILFVLLAVATAGAQDYTQQVPGTSRNQAMMDALNQAASNPFATDEDEELADTTKKERKVRKPLESYFFDDSLRQEGSFAWNVDMYRNKVTRAVIDTLTTGFQITYPFLINGIGDEHQGPLGGASVPLSYFDRPNYENFNFGQAYDTYNLFPDRALFFNVKRPLTIFTYLTAGQKQKAEENFGITHAQNISPSTGFNLDYKSRGTRGVWNWQKMRAKNLSLAASHTGKKYSVHAGYIYNTIQNNENGGIWDVEGFKNPEEQVEQPNVVRTNLNDAYNLIKDNTFYVTQSYGVPLRKLTEDDFSIADQSSIFFGHAFQYSRWHRVYTDTRAQSLIDENTSSTLPQGERPSFYEDWFYSTTTRDSIAEILVSNRLFVQIQPFDRDGIIGTIDAGVGMDNHIYYQFTPDAFLQGPANVKKTGYYAYGSLEGKFRQYLSWGGDVKYPPTGYRSGDLKLGADLSLSAFIKGKPLTLSGRFSHDRRSPSYWSERYFSNHFAWSNSFNKENETRIEASFTMPWAGFELSAYQSVVNNKIYYLAHDGTIDPVQATESVSVTGVYLRKDFRLGGFHFNHRVMTQWSSSQEIIPVPLASAYVSYFFEFNIVRNVLRAQFGFDGRYNTKWYAYGWDPSSANFYVQDPDKREKVGDYPMIDIFLNAKWKRMRILLKLEHFNDDMFGTRNYFSVPTYPQNKRVFKLGFSWSFYD
ncbi:MAG: putative porin [Rikenellaceae bacterium]|nr:putative porin [Rikenellaceae bacterium]